MTITTRFHVHDSVFFMYDNKVCSDQVDHVYTDSRWSGKDYYTEVSYTVMFYTKAGRLPERQLFASKEELLASL
jgi:hypothetical protein